MENKISRKEQALMTRELILDVCKELLNKYSFDDISIAQICKKANISVGAFYHHFKSKSEIIVELYRDIDDYFIQTVLPQCQQLEPIEAIITYLKEQCCYAENMGVDIVKNVYIAQLNNGYDFFSSYARGLPRGLYLLLERAIEEKALFCEQPKLLQEQLLMIGRGVIYYWCVKQGRFDIGSQIEKTALIYLQAYTKADLN